MDTLIVTAKEESFYRVFLGEQAWYPIRLDNKRIEELKWIAVYQTNPVRAVTFYARIDAIASFKNTSRYRINFHEPQEMLVPVVLGMAGTLQGQRYTTLDKLLSARSVADLKPWN